MTTAAGYPPGHRMNNAAQRGRRTTATTAPRRNHKTTTTLPPHRQVTPTAAYPRGRTKHIAASASHQSPHYANHCMTDNALCLHSRDERITQTTRR